MALFGDERPMTAPSGSPVGRRLIRIDPADWSAHPLHTPAFHRPIDIRFGPGGTPFVLDFGEFEMNADKHVCAKAGTGTITRLESNYLAHQ
jgi:hypothetical protein